MTSSLDTAPAVILFAHGSRDPLWRLPIEAVAAQIRSQQPGAAVLCAYLELCTPSLPEAAAELIAEGASQVRVFPLFFGVGGWAMSLLWWIVGVGTFTNYLSVAAILIGLGLIFGFVVSLHYRFMRVGHLTDEKTIEWRQ